MLRQFSAVLLLSVSLLMLALTPVAAANPDIPGNDQFNIEDYAGKIVYVDFWASWCAPCRHSFAFMRALHEQFNGELAIVAINVDESRDDATAFLQAFDPPFDIVYDPAGELASAFEVPGMPTTYLFDRNGRLITRHVGFRQSHIDALQKMVSDAIYDTTVIADND